MIDINDLTAEVQGFVAVNNKIGNKPEMWGFGHYDENSSIAIVDWVQGYVKNHQAILNITLNKDERDTFDIQLININNKEILKLKHTHIPKESVQIIKSYAQSKFSKRVFLMPFDGDLKGIYYYMTSVEMIPNKLLL